MHPRLILLMSSDVRLHGIFTLTTTDSSGIEQIITLGYCNVCLFMVWVSNIKQYLIVHVYLTAIAATSLFPQSWFFLELLSFNSYHFKIVHLMFCACAFDLLPTVYANTLYTNTGHLFWLLDTVSFAMGLCL